MCLIGSYSLKVLLSYNLLQITQTTILQHWMAKRLIMGWDQWLLPTSGNFTDNTYPVKKVPRDKRENLSAIQGNNGIKIHQYFEPDIPALTKAILRPITRQVIIISLLSVSLICKMAFPKNKTTNIKAVMLRKRSLNRIL